MENMMNEEADNFRKHDNDSKETLIAIHKKWATFSRETLTLAKSVHSMAEDLAMTKDHKMALDNYFKQLDEYEQFLNMSIEDLRVLEKKRESNVEMTLVCTQLDFKKIKELFKTEEDENYLCALLQALRWRITRITSAVTRREIVIQYVSNDILSYPISHTLLEKKGNRIKESTIRFVNALASEYMGRSYLIEHDQLINHLILILKSEGMDNNCRRSCLGTIQKLS